MRIKEAVNKASAFGSTTTGPKSARKSHYENSAAGGGPAPRPMTAEEPTSNRKQRAASPIPVSSPEGVLRNVLVNDTSKQDALDNAEKIKFDQIIEAAKQVAGKSSDNTLDPSVKAEMNNFLQSLKVSRINNILKTPADEVIKEFYKRFKTKHDEAPTKRQRLAFEFEVDPNIPFLEKPPSSKERKPKSRDGASEKIGKVDIMQDGDSEFNKVVSSYRQSHDLESGSKPSEQSVLLTNPETVKEFDDIAKDIKESKSGITKTLRTQINSLLEKYNLPKLPMDLRYKASAKTHIVKMFEQGLITKPNKPASTFELVIEDEIQDDSQRPVSVKGNRLREGHGGKT